jgi:hypothetical protein
MTGTFLLSVSNIEMFRANKKFHFTCCFELFFQKPEHMHMDHLKYVKLILYICVKEACKVFGQDSNTKCVVGAIKGVTDAR